jgi:hypothetical protein
MRDGLETIARNYPADKHSVSISGFGPAMSPLPRRRPSGMTLTLTHPPSLLPALCRTMFADMAIGHAPIGYHLGVIGWHGSVFLLSEDEAAAVPSSVLPAPAAYFP